MAGNGGSDVQVTSNDVGPIIAIITWFFMIMMILAVIFRAVVKLFVRRVLTLDDYTVCAALAFGVSQSIIISFSIQDGLGKRKADLDSDQLTSIEKTLYSASLLFILACSLSKISLFLLLQRLAVSRLHIVITKASIYIIIVWMISSFLALAFQCDFPHPWATWSGHCFNQFVFWVSIGFIDIITEIVVMALPIFMVRPVQMAISKKVTVIVCFLFRISVTVVIAVRLYLLHSYQISSDFVFDSESSVIATQALISIAITTACIPALKPFLDSFESGALSIGLERSSGNFSANSYEMSSNMKGSGLRSRNRDVDGNVRPDGTGYLAAISGHGSRRQRNIESNSLESGKSDAMMIKRTNQWAVQYDHNDQAMESARSSAGDGR